MQDLPYLKSIFIGPNPQDRHIFMLDYDNKGYRGGTDSFKSEIKLDKVTDDDVFETFKEELYNFNFDDYPIYFNKTHETSNERYFFEIVKSSIDFLKQNAQIGPPNFIFINKKHFENSRVEKVIRDNIDNILFYDEDDIIIGRKNTNRHIEPGLYLCYDSIGNFSVDVIGNRAKNQYLILKIK